MNQRFIELGQGFSDLYELLELAKSNAYRVNYFLCMEAMSSGGRKSISFFLVLKKSS